MKKFLLFFILLLCILFPDHMLSAFKIDTVWRKDFGNSGIWLKLYGGISHDNQKAVVKVATNNPYKSLLYILDLTTGDTIQTFERYFFQAFFSGDDKSIIGLDNQLYKYNLAERKYEEFFETDGQAYNHAVVSKDGKYIAASLKNGVRVLDATTGKIIKTKYWAPLDKDDVWFRDIYFDKNNNLLLSIENAYIKNTKLYDIKTLTPIRDVFDFTTFFMSSSGKIAYSWFLYQLWDMESYTKITQLPEESKGLGDCILNDKYFITAFYDNNHYNPLQIYDVETGKLLFKSNVGWNDPITLNDGQHIIIRWGHSLYKLKITEVPDNVDGKNTEVMRLSPNPASNTVKVPIEPNLNGNALVNATSVDGRSYMIFSGLKQAGVNFIECSTASLTAGAYILSVSLGNYQKSHKLIIER